jgi:Leucine-rich repeat (LRR) protein
MFALEGLLLLSERYEWSEIGRHKGWAVLIAVAAVGASSAILTLWYVLGFLFGWRFQFTLRSLLLFVVVVAIPCDWFAVELRQARKEQTAVRKLEALNCIIDYLPPPDTPEHPALAREPRAPPSLLRRFLGDCFFEDAGRADCETPRLPDASLENLREMTQLRELWLGCWSPWPEDEERGATDAGLRSLRWLSHLETLTITAGPQLTDLGLENLRNLGELQRLWISNGRGITDAGLESIGALPHLRELTITNSSVTAAGVRHIERLQNLRRLVLIQSLVSDAGLERLKHLSGLRVLVLDDACVTDAGLRHIGAMTELRALSLQNAKVGDTGMGYLRGLTKLRGLSLRGTGVGDAGLEHLSGLTQLEQLDLSGTKASDAGLEHLKGLTRLGELDLTGTKVGRAGNDGFRRLAQSRNLRTDFPGFLFSEVVVRGRRWVYIDPLDN